MKEYKKCLLVELDNEGPGTTTGYLVKTERVDIDYQEETEVRVTILKQDDTEEVFINPRYIEPILVKSEYKFFNSVLEQTRANKELDELVKIINETSSRINSEYNISSDYIVKYLKNNCFF